MRYLSVFCIALLSSALCTAETSNSTLSEQDRVSYALGVKTAENYKLQDIAINAELFKQGFADVVEQQPLQLNQQQIQDTLTSFHTKQVAKIQIKHEKIAKENLVKSQDFLKKNKSKDGVTTTKSGLQYKILATGSGQPPTASDYVTVNYRGTLIDGTEFDSSYKHNQATTFQLTGLISGWKEALELMKPGSKWQLFVPPHLAYGKKGAGQLIQPNATLIFEIELVAVNANNPNASK